MMDTHTKKYYKEISIMKMKRWRNNNEIYLEKMKISTLLSYSKIAVLILNGISCKHPNVNVAVVKNVVSV